MTARRAGKDCFISTSRCPLLNESQRPDVRPAAEGRARGRRPLTLSACTDCEKWAECLILRAIMQAEPPLDRRNRTSPSAQRPRGGRVLSSAGALRKQTPWKPCTRRDNAFSFSTEGDGKILIAGQMPNTLVNDLINCQNGAVCISQHHVFFCFVFFDAGCNAVWLLELNSRSANVRGYRPFQIVGFME